jgi:NAD(P)H-hydrate epimerase
MVNDDEARAKAAGEAARAWDQVVVLKGARTVIAAPDGRLSVAPFENPALATGGTGDVLAGAIGSLLAQGVAPFDAARVGVYLHGLAGDAVRDRLGDAGLLASDLPDEIARARKRLVDLASRRRATKRLGFGAREWAAGNGSEG